MRHGLMIFMISVLATLAILAGGNTGNDLITLSTRTTVVYKNQAAPGPGEVLQSNRRPSGLDRSVFKRLGQWI